MPEKYAEEAIKILREKSEAELEVDYQLEDAEDNPICPWCGSNNTATEKYSRSIAGWTLRVQHIGFI